MSAGISDRPITAAQVRSIHVALESHGIEDPEYRQILGRFGVQTSKDLTRRQASELLRDLGVQLRRPPGDRPSRKQRAPSPESIEPALPPGVTRLPTAAQRALIAALLSEIDWHTEEGYSAWLQSNMGLARVTTATQAQRTIQGLKGVKKHQSRA